ncbi:MAG: triose-phosphate isomerase [Campylobacter sp.]|nr:triose-phosphate isomerase [Campylobacter sp.]
MKFYANLKSNHTRKSFSEYAKSLNEAYGDFANLQNSSVVVFPPASAFINGDFNFIVGAQNFYPAKNGAFTGEICKDMLDEFGINTVMIGHSERRMLGERDELLRAKFEFAKANLMNIVYCVGESEIVFMNGSGKNYIKDELGIIDANYDKLTIAYEPIWAIGTGRAAEISYIEEILEFIKSLSNAPLLYGGSVNENNIKDICAIKNCDGVLVGSASYEAKNFINLIKKAFRA